MVGFLPRCGQRGSNVETKFYYNKEILVSCGLSFFQTLLALLNTA